MATKEVLRAARREECRQLSDLAMRSKAHWGYDAAFMEACRDELTVRPEDIDARCVTVLERDAKVVGFYGIDGDPPAGELWWLFVEPSAIGSGAGRTLWNHATDGAARMGMTTLRIESDPGAEGFYLAMGAVR
ncbi:MAG: GNAT family N-acetyltransferase, partial [bacterium]